MCKRAYTLTWYLFSRKFWVFSNDKDSFFSLIMMIWHMTNLRVRVQSDFKELLKSRNLAINRYSLVLIWAQTPPEISKFPAEENSLNSNIIFTVKIVWSVVKVTRKKVRIFDLHAREFHSKMEYQSGWLGNYMNSVQNTHEKNWPLDWCIVYRMSTPWGYNHSFHISVSLGQDHIITGDINIGSSSTSGDPSLHHL